MSADDKYQEDREQCTRGLRGTGMPVMGAVLQKWSGKAPLGNLISQQRSEGREGTRKTATRKNNISGRENSLGKGSKSRCVCCVLARKPGYLEQSQRGEGKLVGDGSEKGPEATINRQASACSSGRVLNQEANSVSNCVLSALCSSVDTPRSPLG